MNMLICERKEIGSLFFGSFGQRAAKGIVARVRGICGERAPPISPLNPAVK